MRGKGSLFLIVTGFLLYVFDVGSDIYVAKTYHQKEDYWWFGITVALVIIPSIICNFLSLLAINNMANKTPLFNFLVSVFQLSVIQQYWEASKRWKRMNWDKETQQPCNKDNYDECACQNCKSYFKQMKKYAEHDSDLAETRYIEAFAESTPQWCLQFYIMLRQWSFPWITIVSTVFSLLSLAWGITSLDKTRKDFKSTMTFPKKSLIVFTLWQLGILVSRLSAIVIFAYAFRSYVFIVIGIHWTAVIVMKFIIQYHNGDLDGNRRHCKVVLYITVDIFLTSFPLLFHLSSTTVMFASPSKKKTLISNIIYYGIFFLENVIMVSFSVWYEPTSTPHIEFLAKIVLPLVLAGFAIGMLFCGLYYNYLHPSKMEKHKTLNLRAKNDSNENSIENEESQFCNNVQHVTAV